jgi:hypothetical protein
VKGARRSLTHVGGKVTLGGDADAAKALAHALDVPPSTEKEGEGPDRAHVHGFHTYPARMHPITARRLVDAFAPRAGRVLDPFCGSGTVLVEAMLAGRHAIGTDLNPLAVELATLKTRVCTRDELDALVLAAREVAAHADARRKGRAGATRRYPPEDVALFEPHVLLELDGIRDGIAHAPAELRMPLLLVLSALVGKVSRKEGDTSEKTGARRIAAGYTAKIFTRKTEELAHRLDELARAMPRPAPRVSIALDDATRLRTVAPASIDAVVTSPPYVATYDYLAHHALRMRWLGLDARAFERGEIGARRRFNRLRGDDARQAWSDELASVLRATARTLATRGNVVLLIADSAVGRDALRAHDIVAEIADASGLEPVARASQERPHFHGPTAEAFAREPRSEHALLLTKAARSKPGARVLQKRA